MGLIAWFPLNGNINNQGSENITLNYQNSAYTNVTSAGKTSSKCYYNSSYSEGALYSSEKVNIGTTQSMCAWVKFSGLTSDSSLGGSIISQHRYATNTGMGLTIRYVSSSTGYLSVNTGNGSSRTYNSYYGRTLLSANVWYHVAFTFDGTTIKLYVNGVEDGSFSDAHIQSMSVVSDFILVGAWSLNDGDYSHTGAYGGYKLYGYINDARIYNHCLSEQEIKNISKGLCLHYAFNFDDLYEEVDYLQSTGSQYIDPGVSDTGDIQIDCDISFTTVSPDNQIWGFGGNGWMGIGTSGSSWWECSSLGTITTETLYKTTYHKVGTTSIRIVNGTSLSGNNGYATSQYTAKLFAAQGWEGEASIYYYCHIKMYSCKMYVFGELVRDFLPCVRKIDGKPGLFDRVEHKFYTNAGSGDFIYKQATPTLTSVGSGISYDKSTGTITGSSVGTGWGNRGYYSTSTMNSCKISFSCPNNSNTAVMVGLCGSKAYNYTTIEAEFYCDNGNLMTYYSGNSGGNYGTYNANTLLEIIYDGSTASFYKDGSLIWSRSISGSKYLCIDVYGSRAVEVKNLTFHEISRTINDKSYCGNDLIISSMTPSDDTNSGNASMINNNAYNRSTYPVQRDDSNNKELTVSCWFKQTNRSGYQALVVNRWSNGYNWMVYTHADDGSIQLHGNSQYKSSTIPTLNEWHHVVATVNSNLKYNLYLDGVKVATDVSYNYHADSPSYVGIGGWAGNEQFSGYISDVKVFATALSDSDVYDLYHNKAIVDNKGNLFCDTIDAKFGEIQLPTDTGVIKCGDFIQNSSTCQIGAYTILDYIESTGTQFISLPLGADRTDTIKFTHCLTNSSEDDAYLLSGSTWNSNNNRFGMGRYSGSSSRSYTAAFGSMSTSGTGLTPSVSYNFSKMYEWVYSNNKFSIPELNISCDVSSITFGGTTTNLQLFKDYNGCRKGRVGKFVQYKNNVLKLYLIPAKRNSDNVIGLLDTVNNVFYGNSGSGTFTAGPELSRVIQCKNLYLGYGYNGKDYKGELI